ncbi:SDR family NAD(P)-dependent oxidoreductase [Thermomonas flagellata]|uniref:SDR family NAD(P)-dependent oxidoreductase n=1 Tax=Thermomonas flagellata TaxID=2888524 RepID=UPI001F04ED49|nr:SDR family NAD(P)-dependent oxidoreductase [Thermomonas flagellata]
MIDLSGRVAIVTGAGRGLGRAHARLLAQRGAAVLVNDLDPPQAEAVAAEIVAAGGQARAVPGSAADPAQVQALVDAARAAWGRVDIAVANAGLLRDRSFGNLGEDDIRAVLEVHLLGGFYLCKAVWPVMRAQQYGRIVLTTSSSGLYGNFGQANYAAAKMGLVGLMQTLALEGEKYGIRVNCLAPTAATRMLEGILPPEQLALLDPALVSPALLALVAEAAPTRAILCAGAGSFELAHVTLTRGLYLGPQADAETLLARWAELADRDGEQVPATGFDQARHELRKAGLAIPSG